MDWHQLFEIVSLPDNIPIVLIAILVPFYTWYAWKQARANDQVIERLETDTELAKTHHRKREPYRKGWPKVVEVWPYLLKIELLATILVTVLLIVWAIVLNAPLEEPANPNLTMNPAKAPWYFLGLQEMLVYFDPWIAGVVLPTLIIIGLIVIPYCDVNPLGAGYYTWRQRKFALGTFFVGFHVLWLVLIFIGVFVRGPGWMWFWPGEYWDPHRVVNESYQHVPDLFGARSFLAQGIVGVLFLGAYLVIGGGLIHKLYVKYKPETYRKMNIVQYSLMQFLLLTMAVLPLKMVMWHMFRLKYVLITPWFNI